MIAYLVAVLFCIIILPDHHVSSLNILAYLDDRSILIRRLPDALHDCETCEDSDPSCAKRVPDEQQCEEPGYLYLQIFCKKTCNKCQECSTPRTDDIAIDTIIDNHAILPP